jgi:uncharacterized protein YbjQ (UPF0145 family)
LGVGYTAGTIAEKRHYKSIEKRENKFLKLPVVTMKDAFDKNSPILRTRLVQGSAVISIDYFKRMLAALRNIVGGEVKSYETLVDRARREATLRMKKMAWDADIILNLRIETSAIGNSANRRKAIGSIEAIAYGTAITYKK